MKKTGRGWWPGICLWALVIGGVFPSATLAATCEVGDLSKGSWKMIGLRNQGTCIIPGPPHPNSAFLRGPENRGNGAFRIEGKYKVETVVTGKPYYGHGVYPECVSSCITGFAAWFCPSSAGLTWVPTSQLCMQNTAGVPLGCYTDGLVVTLYEWGWTNKECEKEELPPSPTNTPNPDPGKPDCPQLPLN